MKNACISQIVIQPKKYQHVYLSRSLLKRILFCISPRKNHINKSQKNIKNTSLLKTDPQGRQKHTQGTTKDPQRLQKDAQGPHMGSERPKGSPKKPSKSLKNHKQNHMYKQIRFGGSAGTRCTYNIHIHVYVYVDMNIIYI